MSSEEALAYGSSTEWSRAADADAHCARGEQPRGRPHETLTICASLAPHLESDQGVSEVITH